MAGHVVQQVGGMGEGITQQPPQPFGRLAVLQRRQCLILQQGL